MSETSVTNEVNQQFLRRTPIKLRQFSRLLSDMLTQDIEPLRVKALYSQVNKTREACIAQNFESTAKLLNQLQKQLSLSEDALETQKPLLKRLVAKLQEHSQKLELGVRPIKEKKAPEPEIATSEAPELTAEPEVGEDESDSEDSAFGEQSIYLDKNTIIFVDEEGRHYQQLSQQFQAVGVDVREAKTLPEANQIAAENLGCIIVAPLKLAELNEQLADSEVENERVPTIFTAEEDSQEERLLALRSGGTAYMVEPISLSGLLEHIERQYDIHADSPYRVLVMEDSKAQARYYEKVLAKGHFNIRVVNDPRVLLEALRSFEPELVLMDMQMPTCSGIELTRIIRQMPRFAYLPIIFLSAEESLAKQNQALLAGGTSFIVKPVEKQQLAFLAQLYCHRYRELNPQIDSNPDTGLKFARNFKQQIAIETARMSRSSGQIALAILQIDQVAELVKQADFSVINVAVAQLASLLKKRLRKTDFIGHLDTGQIGIILTTGKRSDWMEIVNQIRVQFAELPFHAHHQDVEMSISIGMSELVNNWDAHQWFESANQALSQAVEEGGDRVKSNSAL
ncbi:response regulator [Aliikangiella sp. IMCC44653]